MAPDMNELKQEVGVIKSYKQHIFHFSCENEENHSKLVAKIYKFQNKCFKYVSTSEFSFPHDSIKRHHDICASDVVQNFHTGIKTLYIIIRNGNRKKKTDSMTLTILTVFIKKSSFHLKLLRNITWNDNDAEKFALLAGPTIVIFQKKCLSCILIQNEEKTIFINETSLWLTTYWKGNSSYVSFISSTGELKNISFYNQHEIISHQVIPVKFAVGNHITTAFAPEKHSSFLVVICANQELLEYNKEQVQRWCTLPFADATAIIPYTSNDSYYVIASHSYSVCVVDQKSFHVVQYWDNIQTVLIDDFMFMGKPLLMLIPSINDFNIQVLNESIVTDVLLGNFLKKLSEKPDKKEVLQENKLKSILALQKRLQEAQILFEAASSESNSKLNFLQETVERLQNLSEGKNIQLSECQPTLIKIKEGKSVKYGNAKDNMKSPIVIVQLYKTFLSENLILIVQIANQSKRILGNITLKLSTDEYINYFVKYFCVKKDLNALLLPDESMLLATVVPINQHLFSLLNVILHIAIIYQILENETLLPFNNHWSRMYQTSFGTIPICRDGFKDQIYTHWIVEADKVDKFPIENLKKVARIATAHSVVLTLKSVVTDLLQLKQMLQNLFHLKEELDMLSWKESPVILDIWLEILGKGTSNEIDVQIYYSQEYQVLMFLQLLYKNFPNDVCAIPCSKHNYSDLLRNHLKEELKFLLMPLDSLHDEREEKLSSQPENCDVLTQFALEQSMFERSTDGIKIKNYQSFKQQLTFYELKCDELVGMIQNHAFVSE